MSQFVKRFHTKLPVDYFDIPKPGDFRKSEHELSLKIKGFIKILKCYEKYIPPRNPNAPIGGKKTWSSKPDLRGPDFLIQCNNSSIVFTLKFILRNTNVLYKNFDNLIYLNNWNSDVMVFLKIPSKT